MKHLKVTLPQVCKCTQSLDTTAICVRIKILQWIGTIYYDAQLYPTSVAIYSHN